MKDLKWTRRLIHGTLLGGGTLLCVIAHQSISDTLFALGTGVIASTLVSVLLNIEMEKKSERQRMVAKSILLDHLFSSAIEALTKMLIAYNVFIDALNVDILSECNADVNFYRYLEKGGISTGKLTVCVNDISDAFQLFILGKFDIPDDPCVILKSNLRRLFMKDQKAYNTFVEELLRINPSLLFCLGFITQKEQEQLSNIYQKQALSLTLPNGIKSNEDIKVCGKYLHQVAIAAKRIIFEFAEPLSGKTVKQIIDEIESSALELSKDEVYSWNARTPTHIMLRNITQ